MSRFRISIRSAVAVVLVTSLTVGLPAGDASAAGLSDPLLSGLAGPLGLAVGRDGTVYVTEAFAGRLTAIDGDDTKVLVEAPGQELAGVDARGEGKVVYTQTLFDGEPGEEAPPLDALLGRVKPNGSSSTTASLQDYEQVNNPDGANGYGLVGASQACIDQVNAAVPPATYTGIIESHPYAVTIAPGGYLVADAAANAIFHVRESGQVSTVAVLPPVEQTVDQGLVDAVALVSGADVSECLGETYFSEPVPTDIEIGPDGNYYVSTLPGFPEMAAAGAIWNIDRHSGDVELVASGLAGPVDIAIARDGTIYVAELFGFQISTIVDGIIVDSTFAHSPGAIEVSPSDGTIYATVGVFDEVNGGSVVIFTP